MLELFKDFPEALANTVRIAERCDVEIRSGQNHLPKFEVPERDILDDYFEDVARQGFAEWRVRRQLHPEYSASS